MAKTEMLLFDGHNTDGFRGSISTRFGGAKLVRLVINSQMSDDLDGDCAIQENPIHELSCGIDLKNALTYDPASESELGDGPSVDFGSPLQDWFEMALQSEAPKRAPIRNSWGDEDEDADDDLSEEELDEEEQDPFEDFDEDDFDDDFDDDFEEELDDEYEIEPADDGMVPGMEEDGDEDLPEDEDIDIDPGIEDLD